MELSKKYTDDSCIVSIVGRLDTSTAPEFETYLQDIFGEDKDLVLDFTDLAYISSAGLRVLLMAQKEKTKIGKEVRITGVNEVTNEILEITGFADILKIEN